MCGLVLYLSSKKEGWAWNNINGGWEEGLGRELQDDPLQKLMMMKNCFESDTGSLVSVKLGVW